MNKYLSLIVLAAVVGCGEGYNEEIGTLVESQSAKQGSGWRDDDGWDHGVCDLNNSSHVCYWPHRRNDGQGFYRRLSNNTLTGAGLPTGVDITFAHNHMMSILTNQLSRWEFFGTTQGVDSNLRILRDDTIYTGTPPNTSIPFSSIAHIACTEYGVDLSEDPEWPGSANSCKQVTMWLDVQSFTAWVNQWATNANQKQAVLNGIFVHAGGVAVGLGSTSATGTAMRNTLTKTSSPVMLSTYEVCQANGVLMLDGSYLDPLFGMYSNSCD